MIWRCVSLKPINIGGHSAYQDRVLTQLRKYYPNAASSLSSSTWQILDPFLDADGARRRAIQVYSQVFLVNRKIISRHKFHIFSLMAASYKNTTAKCMRFCCLVAAIIDKVLPAMLVCLQTTPASVRSPSGKSTRRKE